MEEEKVLHSQSEEGSNMLEKIKNTYPDTQFLKADGFDGAVIGVCAVSMRLIYSVGECLGILEKDMSPQSAREYFEFNVLYAYVGENTPIWCESNF